MTRNVSLTLSGCLVLLTGLAVGTACKQVKTRPEPELREVGISRAAADSLAVVPPVVRVYPGDAIAWSSNEGDWVIELPDDLRAVPLTVRGRRGETAVTHIRSDAEEDRYKYDVILIAGEDSIRLDPLVIVDRG